VSTLAVGGSQLRPLPLFRVMVGDPLAGGLVGAQVATVTFNLTNYINGRVRGNFHQDQAGVLQILYGNDSTTMDLDFVVPQDVAQPNFQYAFDIIVIQPFCQITFTNGGAASSFFRAYVSALPV
jgi:hypothetical protein